MLLTVTIISASILGATTIAGTLMLYQIRQANDILNSTKAIYAADAGIERGLYCANGNIGSTVQADDCTTYGDSWELSNDTKVYINPPPESPPVAPVVIRTIGESNRVQRAFEIVIQITE